MYTCIDKTMQIVLERGSIDGMPNTYACKGVSNPNVPIFPPRVCTLVLFITIINHGCERVIVVVVCVCMCVCMYVCVYVCMCDHS